MRARYYSPEMHRFINADFVAGETSNAITLNRFAYANGNPVSFVDPFGSSAFDFIRDAVAKGKKFSKPVGRLQKKLPQQYITILTKRQKQ